MIPGIEKTLWLPVVNLAMIMLFDLFEEDKFPMGEDKFG